jgi:iron(III) transport system permease protein
VSSTGSVVLTPAASGPRARPQGWREAPIQYGTALLTLVLVAAPLLPVLYQSVVDRALYDEGKQFTLANFARLAGTEGFGLVLRNTFAALTTLIAQALGTLAAVLFGRTDMPAGRVLGELFLWPIYLSALVLSFGWYTVYGPSGYLTLLWKTAFEEEFWNLYSLAGMATIAGVSQAPVAYIYCMSSATACPRRRSPIRRSRRRRGSRAPAPSAPCGASRCRC